MIELGIKLTLAYLVGSVLGSLVVGRFHGGIDIRKAGSGNAGGTNALRTHGKVFAFWVLVIDVGKGVLAAAWLPALELPGIGLDPVIPRAFVFYGVGVAVVVGHIFPLWFGFRGGKGGATGAGVLIYYAPFVAVPILVLWIALILLTGFVGLATMAAAVGAAAIIGVVELPAGVGVFTFACAVAALIVFAHRSNLRRMLAGTEPRVRLFRKG